MGAYGRSSIAVIQVTIELLMPVSAFRSNRLLLIDVSTAPEAKPMLKKTKKMLRFDFS